MVSQSRRVIASLELRLYYFVQAISSESYFVYNDLSLNTNSKHLLY